MISFQMITIPTLITMIRILLAPCMVSSMIAQAWPLACLLFLLAAVTDVVDGALARFLNKVTVVGALLDPLADKILLISSYAGLMYLQFAALHIPFWFLVIVIINESVLVAASIYIGFVKGPQTLQPTRLGKMTSFGQVLFILWFFACGFTQASPYHLFSVLLLLVTMSRLCAFMQYAVTAFGVRNV